MTKTLH